MGMVEDMAEDMHNKAIMGDMLNKAITDLSLLGIKSMILSNDLCRGNIFEISPKLFSYDIEDTLDHIYRIILCHV